MIYKRCMYIIGNDKGFFLIKRDKKVIICDSEGIRDTFDILLEKKNVIKIRYNYLPRYYLKEINNYLILNDSKKNDLFKLIKKNNDTYSFVSVESNLAITVNDDNLVIMEKYKRNNKRQEFIIKRIEY